MAIDFPASPTTNDTFTVGNTTYKWDGEKWTTLNIKGIILTDGGNFSTGGSGVSFSTILDGGSF